MWNNSVICVIHFSADILLWQKRPMKKMHLKKSSSEKKKENQKKENSKEEEEEEGRRKKKKRKKRKKIVGRATLYFPVRCIMIASRPCSTSWSSRSPSSSTYYIYPPAPESSRLPDSLCCWIWEKEKDRKLWYQNPSSSSCTTTTATAGLACVFIPVKCGETQSVQLLLRPFFLFFGGGKKEVSVLK